MNGKNVALVAAAGVIAYLIYLYEKKKGVVASQITSYQQTATQPGTSIPLQSTANQIDAILSSVPLPSTPLSISVPTGQLPAYGSSDNPISPGDLVGGIGTLYMPGYTS